MDLRLVTLELFLDELGVPAEIRTVEDRKRVQKAVYLGQLTGIDLGYRYSWYLKGPYSPALARDYYALAEALEQGDHAGAGHVLKPAAKEQLGRVRSLLAVPAGVPLDAAAWYELLASQHYLLKVSHYDATQAKQTIAQQKRHLSDWFDRGIDALRQHGLI